MRGADVFFIYGHVDVPIPAYLKQIQINSTDEMRKAVLSNLKNCDIVILTASVSDFAPERASGKISSNKRKLTIELKKLPKISDEIKKINKKVKLVLFKAESNVSDSKLVKMAIEKLKQSNADLILANDVSRKGIGFGSDMNEVMLINKRGVVGKEIGEKREIAKKLLDYVAKIF